MKQYIHRYWRQIKYHSYDNKKGYNPDYIQEMIYGEMRVVIERTLIKQVVKEVRYDIKLHKQNQKRKRERKHARKQKSQEE